jgi:hypothetical protein
MYWWKCSSGAHLWRPVRSTEAMNAWCCSCKMAQPRSLWPAPVDEPLALAMRSRDVVCVWPAREEGNGGVRWCGVVVATTVLPLKNKRFILGHNNPSVKKHLYLLPKNPS